MPTGPGYVPTFYEFTYLPGTLIFSSLNKTKSVCHLIQGVVYHHLLTIEMRDKNSRGGPLLFWNINLHLRHLVVGHLGNKVHETYYLVLIWP